jgi:BirA family biotin operon repressor/biotin-[acetyl-CoA-carboxylase] ligase
MVTGVRGDHARPRLAGSRFHDLRWVAETGSTNRDLLDLARAGAPDGVVLVADHQTAGRGRLDRTWVAPPGASLLLSVLLRPTLDAADAPLLTVAMALAVAHAAAARAAAARLKWPNDVVVDDPPRKLAGILAESVVDAAGSLAVVVGVGVNVQWPTPLPPELAPLAETATALNLVTGASIERDDMLTDVLRGFELRCARLEEPDPTGRAAVVDEARAVSATLGRRVRADLGTGVLEGTAVDLDERGDLVVVDDEGRRHVVVAGDVVHLRI